MQNKLSNLIMAICNLVSGIILSFWSIQEPSLSKILNAVDQSKKSIVDTSNIKGLTLYEINHFVATAVISLLIISAILTFIVVLKDDLYQKNINKIIVSIIGGLAIFILFPYTFFYSIINSFHSGPHFNHTFNLVVILLIISLIIGIYNVFISSKKSNSF